MNLKKKKHLNLQSSYTVFLTTECLSLSPHHVLCIWSSVTAYTNSNVKTGRKE